MLVENLMDEIGFTAEEQREYYQYKNLVGNQTECSAEAYMHGKVSFQDALTEVHKLESDRLHPYTIDLLFLLDCTSYLLEKYMTEGISKEVFVNTMKDIKYKLEECIRVKHRFGTFTIGWYEGFLCLRRIALGRLQYDISTYHGESITVCDYTMRQGDFCLGCHIPSSGPLKPELCMESFQTAYEFFRDKLHHGILPIRCSSWLLYPPYREVFGKDSNTADFAGNFKILQSFHHEEFSDAWRVFGMELDGDIGKLPANTTMQRNFIDYMKKGNCFGEATGLLLFDGKRVLTRQT